MANYGEAGIINTTIRNNKSGPGGSTLENNGRLEMARSTVHDNVGEAGSSTLRNIASASIVNSTITDNEGQEQVVENAAKDLPVRRDRGPQPRGRHREPHGSPR